MIYNSSVPLYSSAGSWLNKVLIFRYTGSGQRFSGDGRVQGTALQGSKYISLTITHLHTGQRLRLRLREWMLGSSDSSELRHDVRDMHCPFLLVLFHSTNEQATIYCLFYFILFCFMYFIFLLFLFFIIFFLRKICYIWIHFFFYGMLQILQMINLCNS